MIVRYNGTGFDRLDSVSNRVWIGTTEAFEAAKDSIPNNTVVYITDDTGDSDTYPTTAIYSTVVSGMTATYRDSRDSAHSVTRDGNTVIINASIYLTGNCTTTAWYPVADSATLNSLIDTNTEKIEWGYASGVFTGTGFTDNIGSSVFIPAGTTSASIFGQAIGYVVEK